MPTVCAGTLPRTIAWFAARGKFNTRFGRSAVAVRVVLSPGHKTKSLEAIVTVWALAPKKVREHRKKSKCFFISRNDAQI